MPEPTADRCTCPRLGLGLGSGVRAVRGRRPPPSPGPGRPQGDGHRPRPDRARASGHRDRPPPLRGARAERLPGRRRLGGPRRPRCRDLAGRPGDHLGRAPAPVRVHPQRGRREPPDGRPPGRRAGHRRQRRRRVPRRRPRRRLQPAPAGALPRGGLVQRRHAGRRAQQGRPRPTTSRAGCVAVEAIAPGVPIVTLSALTGDHVDRPRAVPAARHDGRRARVVGRRQVHARERPARRGAPGDGRGPRGRLAGPPHDHAPRALRAARAAPCSSTRRASARSRWPAPTRASRPPSTTSSSSRRQCRFSDCRHGGEPGCAVRAALADGRLTRGPARQPPQARARAGPRGAQGGPAGPRRRTSASGASSTSPSTSTWHASTETTDDDRRRSVDDEIAVPGRPDVPGLRFRRFRAPPTTRAWPRPTRPPATMPASSRSSPPSAMARDYEHLVNCDPDSGHPRRRARRLDRRLRPDRVAGPDRRVPRLHLDLPRRARRIGAWASAGAMLALVRVADGGAVAAGAAGGPAREDARPSTWDATRAPRPARPDAAGRRRARATRWSVQRSTTSPRCRCPTASRSGLSMASPRTGASGRPPPRRSATSATRASGPRRTGRSVRPTRIAIRALGRRLRRRRDRRRRLGPDRP